jgi:hypothetical protein
MKEGFNELNGALKNLTEQIKNTKVGRYLASNE